MPTFEGLPACSCHVEWIPAFRAELKRQGVSLIRFTRLIYRGGGTSGDTHWPGGGGDGILVSVADYVKAVKIARNMGAAAWHRVPAQGFIHHLHFVLKGCPHNSGGRYQIGALEAGFNGLGRNGRGGKDDGPRTGVTFPLRTFKQGITWAKGNAKPVASIRPMTFNVPGPDKIKTPEVARRIDAAVKTVVSGKPTVIGWNELEGIKRPGVASDFAKALDADLGAAWKMVKPTLPLNENYLSYRGDLVTLVKRYPDLILTGKTGGRHLTRAVFKDKATGFVHGVGQFHLVNDGGAQGQKDRQSQAKQALTAMNEMVTEHDDCEYVIQGDANTHVDLTALTKAGMKRTRTYADESGNRDATTYTKYGATKPSANTDWIIDHQYVTPGLYVVGYTVLQQLNSHGNFMTARASDHCAVVSSVRPIN